MAEMKDDGRDDEMCVIYEPFEELKDLDVEHLTKHVGWFVFAPYREVRAIVNQGGRKKRHLWYDFLGRNNLMSQVMARYRSTSKEDDK